MRLFKGRSHFICINCGQPDMYINSVGRLGLTCPCGMSRIVGLDELLSILEEQVNLELDEEDK